MPFRGRRTVSVRLGRDSRRHAPHEPSGVPTAVACFTGDHAIRGPAARSHRIVRRRRDDTGGHVASHQASEVLVSDPVAAVTEVGV